MFGNFFNYDNDLLILIIGITSILFAIILFITDKYCLTVNNQEGLDFKLALLAGLFQCLALIPGVSRAGANIIALRFMGLTEEILLLDIQIF